MTLWLSLPVATGREAEAFPGGLRDALALELGTDTSVRMIPREKSLRAPEGAVQECFDPSSLRGSFLPVFSIIYCKQLRRPFGS